PGEADIDLPAKRHRRGLRLHTVADEGVDVDVREGGRRAGIVRGVEVEEVVAGGNGPGADHPIVALERHRAEEAAGVLVVGAAGEGGVGATRRAEGALPSGSRVQ